MNADGTHQRNLTRNPASDVGPVWLPDGRKIVYQSDRSGRRWPDEAYIMNADGSEQRKWGLGFPVWSPDGRRIAFVSGREIYVMNVDGSGKRRLTRNTADDGSAAWSPDGQKIVFTTDRDGNEAIYIMNADGTGQRKLTP